MGEQPGNAEIVNSEKNEKENKIDLAEINSVVESFLRESEQYDVECLDLKEEVVRTILNWFEDKKDELKENFADLFPQIFPAKQELLDKLRLILPLDRIHVNDVGLEFRRTKIVDNWVSEIYEKILKKVFKRKL